MRKQEIADQIVEAIKNGPRNETAAHWNASLMELTHDYDAEMWDKPVSHFELLQRFRAWASGQMSQKAIAEHLGVSAAYVNDILHGRREISLYVGRKLGFEKVTVFLARGDE